MDGWHETEVRVRYAETDQMGVAHHSNYLIWFEAGRSDFCRGRGFSYKEMEEKEGALLVVAESYVRYKSPAFYEDILIVRTRVGEVRSRSLRFIYRSIVRLMICCLPKAKRSTWSPTNTKKSALCPKFTGTCSQRKYRLKNRSRFRPIKRRASE